MSFWLHLEGKSTVTTVEVNRHPISTTIKLARDDFKEELKLLPESSIIIAPAYFNPVYGFDYQMCLTGKVKMGEIPEKGMVREISEEIGLNLDYKKMSLKTYSKGKKTIYFSSIELTPDVFLEDKKFVSKEDLPDNHSQHLCCFLYFKEENLSKISQILINRNRIPSSDTAGEKIVCLPKFIVSTILEKWENNHIRKADKEGWCFFLR